jgi:acetyl-CoA acetyltransferase
MSKQHKLSRGVAVVGAGTSQFGFFQNKGSKDLFLEAFNDLRQSVDRGLDPNEIEALYIGNFTNDTFVRQGHWGCIIADQLGIAPKPATRTEGACASSALSFREGVFAIASGMYDVVLVGGFEEMSKCTTEEVADGLALGAFPYEKKVGFTFPGIFGAVATAYFAKYGATRENLMDVTLKSHRIAPLNPKGQIRQTIQDIMQAKIDKAAKQGKEIPAWGNEKDFLRDPNSNPVIAWPMNLYDCCPISDGASCMLLVAEEIAKNFTDNPIYLAGLGQGSGRGFCGSESLTSFEATKHAAQEAYRMSGLTPEDIQFCEVHDCFSIAEIIATEDLGFFKPGDGFRAASERLTDLSGVKPINTSGGLKCKGHPVGATGTSQLLEVWKQLRREAGNRQIPNDNLRIGAAHNLGGTGGTCTFTILEKR